MGKIRGKYDIWVIVVIIVGLVIALLISWSLIRGLETQMEEQTEQVEQITYTLERCKRAMKAHQLERDIFDDIINDRLSIHVGFTHTSDPLRSRNKIKY